MPVPSAVCIRGPVGAPGTNGETPTITSKKTDGVTTIQFKTSSTVYDVQIKDGERGPEGPKGQQGPQGDAGDTPEIIQPAAGSTPIVATDSADRPLRGLTVYGQTTQDGMPSEDAPVEMHSVGDAGEVTVSVLAGLPEGGTDRIAIIRQPRGVTAAVDSAATFRVFAIGRGLTYQWEYMPTTSTTWRNNTFPGNDTDTLTFSAKAYHDGYKYRCLITDASGNTVRTDEVTLTIGKASGSSDGAADTQTAAISITDGLRGVPVTGSAATYTDADGQGWIADTIEYDAQTGTAQLVRRVGRVTFNGNAGEEWTLDTQNNPYLAIAVQGKAPGGGLCTHYSRAEIEPGTNQTGFSAAASGDKIVFRPADFATITVDAWRARLNASPVTVLYALAVPVVTELSGDALTAMSALRSRYPATTIYNDAGAQMAARYIADTKKYVDGADAEIAKAVIGVDERVDAAMENIADAGKRADAAQTKAGENERNIGLLKDDLTNKESIIIDFIQKGYSEIPFVWEVGAIKGMGGTDDNDVTNKIRTVGMYKIPSDFKYSASDAIPTWCYQYSSTGVYEANPDISGLVFDETKLYRFVRWTGDVEKGKAISVKKVVEADYIIDELNKLKDRKECEVVSPFKSLSTISSNCSIGNPIEFVSNSYRRVFCFEIEKINRPKGIYIEGFGTGTPWYAVCDENDIVLSLGEAVNARKADYVNLEVIENAKKIYVVSTYSKLVGFYYYGNRIIYKGDKIHMSCDNVDNGSETLDGNNTYKLAGDGQIVSFSIPKTVCRSFGFWVKIPTYEEAKKLSSFNFTAYNSSTKVAVCNGTSWLMFQLGEWNMLKFYMGDTNNEIDRIDVTFTSGEPISILIADFVLVNNFNKPSVIINFDHIWEATDACGAYDYFSDNNIPISITGVFKDVSDSVRTKVMDNYKKGLFEIGIYSNEQRDTNSIDANTASYNTVLQRLNNIIDSKISDGFYPESFGGGQHYITPQIKKALDVCNFKSIRGGTSAIGGNSIICKNPKYIFCGGDLAHIMMTGDTMMYFNHGLSSDPSAESDPSLYGNYSKFKAWVDNAIALRDKGGLDFHTMSNYVRLVENER